MQKSLLVFVFLLTATYGWIVQAQTNDGATWANRVSTGTEVITTLQFYFHDQASGPNPSAVRIAQPLRKGTNNSSSPSLFGDLIMIDDPLTVGPDPSSKIVGRARGLYGFASQNEMALIMALSFVFTDGIYNGSSFSMLSINPITHTVREMAIVGGTGLFRMGRGYVIAETVQVDFTTGDALVKYNVTVATTYI